MNEDEAYRITSCSKNDVGIRNLGRDVNRVRMNGKMEETKWK